MFEEVWRAYEENELSHSAAHHLMAVHELREAHGYARVSDVAKHLSITKGSVSTAMKHLKERGYVQEDLNRFLELTEQGLKVVQEVEETRLVVAAIPQRRPWYGRGRRDDRRLQGRTSNQHGSADAVGPFSARVVFGRTGGQWVSPDVPRRCHRVLAMAAT